MEGVALGAPHIVAVALVAEGPNWRFSRAMEDGVELADVLLKRSLAADDPSD